VLISITIALMVSIVSMPVITRIPMIIVKATVRLIRS
jgi:hypothetical protein